VALDTRIWEHWPSSNISPLVSRDYAQVQSKQTNKQKMKNTANHPQGSMKMSLQGMEEYSKHWNWIWNKTARIYLHILKKVYYISGSLFFLNDVLQDFGHKFYNNCSDHFTNIVYTLQWDRDFSNWLDRRRLRENFVTTKMMSLGHWGIRCGASQKRQRMSIVTEWSF